MTKFLEINKNDKRPIAKFYRSWIQDMNNQVPANKCRGITCDQFKAADRLASSFVRACSYSSNSHVRQIVPQRGKLRMFAAEAKLEAMFDYSKVMKRLNKKSRDIIDHVCIKEQPVRHYELEQIPCWVKGAGTARLREALDELVEIYRNLEK